MNTKFKLQANLLVLILSLLGLFFTNWWISAQVGGDDTPDLQSAVITGGVFMGSGIAPEALAEVLEGIGSSRFWQ